MSGAFDPYHTWLGIPPAEQPPHHYRLLGLALYEGNPSVIDHAADRLMIHLRTMASGPHGALSQRIITEVMLARVCLIDPSQKASYDAQLRKRLGAASAPSATPAAPLPMPKPATARPVVARPLPVAPPPAAQAPQPVAPQPMPAPPANVQQPPLEATPVFETTAASPRRPAARRGKSDSGTSVPMAVMSIVKIVVGGLGGLSLALLIVWVSFRSDPLGLFQPADAKNAAKNSRQPKTVNVEESTDRPSTRGSSASTTTSTPSSAASTSAKSSNSVANPTTTPTTKATVEPQPVEPRPVQPVEPAPPVAAPIQPQVRLPQPATAEQEAKLAELKEIYQAEFEGANRPGTRETFPDFLLDTAERLPTDPVARFVLFREAFTRLIAAKEFELAAETVDRLDQEFLLDPFTLRIHTLSKASDVAKLPAERLAIVMCASELAQIALGRQQLKEATTLARMADGHARNLTDTQLKARVVALRAEVEEAAEQWGPVERARATLAANPDDAAAATIDGRYRCLVEGDWQVGLALLAKASDQQLSAAAQQDLTGPSGEITTTVLGDNWFTIAEADDKLVGLHARARHWYLKAVEGATGLDKARLDQRLKKIDEARLPARLLAGTAPPDDQPLPPLLAMFSRTAAFDSVDLFKFVLKPELLASPWNYDQNSNSAAPAIYSNPTAAYGRVPAHFNPPREYQMSMQVVRAYTGSSTRTSVTGPLVVGLVGPRGQFAAVLDYPLGNEFVSMLTVTAAKGPDDNATLVRHSSPLVRTSPSSRGQGSTIACQVRRNSVSVLVDGTVACQYEGDLSKLSLPGDWAVNDKRAFLVGAHKAGFQVRQWKLDPVSREASATPEPQPDHPFGRPGPGPVSPPRQPPPPGFPPQPGFAP